jgi:hypothetical protein
MVKEEFKFVIDGRKDLKTSSKIWERRHRVYQLIELIIIKDIRKKIVVGLLGKCKIGIKEIPYTLEKNIMVGKSSKGRKKEKLI